MWPAVVEHNNSSLEAIHPSACEPQYDIIHRKTLVNLTSGQALCRVLKIAFTRSVIVAIVILGDALRLRTIICYTQDLFPGLEVPSNDYGEFSEALDEQLEKHGLQKVWLIISIIVFLYSSHFLSEGIAARARPRLFGTVYAR